MNEKFYEIMDASTDTKGFAWASGFGLFPEIKPLITDPFLTVFIESERLSPREPGLRIDDGDPWAKAKKWPDFLGHGASHFPFFLSETVVEDLRANGAPIARAIEMPIAEIQAAGLRSVPPPKYFVLETVPGIEVDFTASGIPTDADGKPVPNPLPKPWPPVWCLKASSWNGADLFCCTNYGGPLTLIATEKIVELARKQKWSNCRFEPLRAV
jgi:hypothetical protein